MKGTVLLALASALWQTLNPSPRATIKAARPCGRWKSRLSLRRLATG